MTNCVSLLVISVCFSFLSITAAFQRTNFHHQKYKFAFHHKNAIPGRYLIEFKPNTGHNNAFFDDLKDQFQAIDLNQDTLVSSDATFRSLHVNDASMDDSQHNNLLQSLVDQDDVVAVYPVTLIDRPNAVSNGYYSRIKKNVTETIQAHQLTQVDRLHKELGLTGKGIKVCVIDSGIDFNHPALGGGFGPGYKVSFGADLVGDNFDPESSNNTVVPDGTPPLDNCGQVDIKSSGHGTHVAGIIAGKDDSKGFLGVAPGVELNVWRVFSCAGRTSSDVILKAMVEAEKAKCDVINMSLGNPTPWTEFPHAAFAQKLAKKGISVVVANGNSGNEGAFTVSDPAGAHDVLSIGSASNDHFLGSVFYIQSSKSDKNVGPYSYKTSYASELEIADGDVVLGGNDDDISECKPSTSSNDKDDDNENSRFKGKLVLVQNGPCELEEQAMVLGKKGASGVVFFSSQEMDPRKVPFFNVSIPIATLSSFSGHELVSILKNKKKDETIHLHFDGNARVFKSSAAKKMADSTSIGPTMELDLKPSLAAIGTDVYSTLPHYLGGWGTLSGTSMASPYIAGTIALLKEAFGKDVSTSVIHERLMNYARLLESRREDWAENPLRQGSGLLQAYDALKEPLQISPAQISFNDTLSKTEYKTHNLEVKNNGTEEISCSISNLQSIGIAPYGTGNTEFQLVQSIDTRFYANTTVELKVSQTSFTLKPGEKTNISVSVQLPKKFIESEKIMYGGFLRFIPEKGREVKVPYFGVLGALYDLPTLDVEKLHIKDPSGKSYKQDDTYHFKLSDKNATAPTISFGFVTPTRIFNMDLINMQGKRVGYIMPSYKYVEVDLVPQDVSEVNPWNGLLVSEEDHLSNETSFMVSPGTYQIRWSALRLFGDANKENDWIVHRSGPIAIKA